MEAGISEDALFSFTQEHRLPKLTRPVTKGIAYELNEFRVEYGYSWDEFYDWLTDLCERQLPSLRAIRTSISRLLKKRSELSCDKKESEIDKLFQEPLFAKRDLCECTVRELSNGVADGLTSALKLSRSNIHNISRKLKRREKKIQIYEIRYLTIANKAKSEEVERSQKRVVCKKPAKWWCRTATYCVVKQSKKTSTKASEIQTELHDIKERLMDKINTLNSRIEEFVGCLDKAQLERDTLATRVCELEASKVTTKEHKCKYRDSVRHTFLKGI